MNIRTRKTARGERRYQARVPGMKSRTFRSRDDAKRWALEQERRRSLGEMYSSPPEPFGDVLDGLFWRETGLRPKSEKDRNEIAKLLVPFRPVLMSSLYRAEVEDEIARIAKRAPRQAQRALALTKRVVRAAKSRGQQVDPAIFEIPSPRYESTEGRALSLADMQSVAGRMPDYIRRIVPVAGLTGLRQGELFDLLDSDLDLEAGTLLVRGGKTKAARRTVHLCAEARRLLREQLLIRPIGGDACVATVGRPNRAESSSAKRGRIAGNERESKRAVEESPAGLVFPTLTGKRWSATNFMSRHFRPALRAAGLEGVRFHDLRHSFVTRALSAGAPVAALAKQLGHVDGGALLLKKYGHLQDDAGAVIALALDSLAEDQAEVAHGGR